MTYTPLQIEIIKRFGKKELTEGCLIGTFYGAEINKVKTHRFTGET